MQEMSGSKDKINKPETSQKTGISSPLREYTRPILLVIDTPQAAGKFADYGPEGFTPDGRGLGPS